MSIRCEQTKRAGANRPWENLDVTDNNSVNQQQTRQGESGRPRETRVDAIAFEQLQQGDNPRLKQTSNEQAAATSDWQQRKDVFKKEILKFGFCENELRILLTAADYSYGLCRLTAPFPTLLLLAQLAGVRPGDIRTYLDSLEAKGVIHVRELLDENNARIGYGITPVFQSRSWRMSEDKLRPRGSEQDRMDAFEAADRQVRAFAYELESKACLSRWLISPLKDADLQKAQNELTLDGPTPKKSESVVARANSPATADPKKSELGHSLPDALPVLTPKKSESASPLMSECVNADGYCFTASSKLSSLNAPVFTKGEVQRLSAEAALMDRIKAIINRDRHPDRDRQPEPDGPAGKLITYYSKWGGDWRNNYVRVHPAAVESALTDTEQRIRANPDWHPRKPWQAYLKDLVQRYAGLKAWNA